MLSLVGAGILSLCLGWIIGSKQKHKRLASALRHTEAERNDLHVQVMTQNEVIENLELDIKRYVEELQMFTQMHKEGLEELVQLKIALDQKGPLPQSETQQISAESQEFMTKVLRSNISRLTGEIEQLKAEQASHAQVFKFLQKVQEENKDLRLAIQELEQKQD